MSQKYKMKRSWFQSSIFFLTSQEAIKTDNGPTIGPLMQK